MYSIRILFALIQPNKITAKLVAGASPLSVFETNRNSLCPESKPRISIKSMQDQASNRHSAILGSISANSLLLIETVERGLANWLQNFRTLRYHKQVFLCKESFSNSVVTIPIPGKQWQVSFRLKGHCNVRCLASKECWRFLISESHAESVVVRLEGFEDYKARQTVSEGVARNALQALAAHKRSDPENSE